MLSSLCVFLKVLSGFLLMSSFRKICLIIFLVACLCSPQSNALQLPQSEKFSFFFCIQVSFLKLHLVGHIVFSFFGCVFSRFSWSVSRLLLVSGFGGWVIADCLCSNISSLFSFLLLFLCCSLLRSSFFMFLYRTDLFGRLFLLADY